MSDLRRLVDLSVADVSAVFRGTRPLRDRELLAVFNVMTRFPEGYSYMKFVFHRTLEHPTIELNQK
jgi:hypothetical protein